MIYLVNENKTKSDPIFSSKTLQKDVACGFLIHLHTVCTQHDIALLEKHKVRKQRYSLDLCSEKEGGAQRWGWRERSGNGHLGGNTERRKAKGVWSVLPFSFHVAGTPSVNVVVLPSVDNMIQGQILISTASRRLLKPSAHRGGSASDGPTPNDKPGDINELREV